MSEYLWTNEWVDTNNEHGPQYAFVLPITILAMTQTDVAFLISRGRTYVIETGKKDYRCLRKGPFQIV